MGGIISGYFIDNLTSTYTKVCKSYKLFTCSQLLVAGRNYILGIDANRRYLSEFKGGGVRLDLDSATGIAFLCLNRPEKKNAMTGEMMVQLSDHITRLEKWSDGKGVIFYGEGNFCSGGDLQLAKQSGCKEGAEAMNEWMADALSRLKKLPLITVCLISGPTLGGGAEMSTFCDYIIAADDVKFGYVHGKMEIIPAWGGGTSLVQRLGLQAALDLMLTSRIIYAEECVDIGLAEAVVSSLNALKEVEDWLQKKCIHHHTITRSLKQICSKASTSKFEEAITYEGRKFSPFWGSEKNKMALCKNIKHVEQF